MNTRKLSVILATMVALLVVTTGVASATTGPDCSTGRNNRGFLAGKLVGKSIVQQAWNASSQNPDDFDTFATVVRNTVHTAIHNLATDASDYVQCRAKGMAQAVCDQLGVIQDGIGDACLLDGQDWGDLSAELYCSLSEAFGGLDVTGLLPHVTVHNVCGQNFEEGCQDEFASAANTTTCHQFIVAPFVAVFQESQTNMCIYETP
jgi:hypothetical protein